MALQVKGKIQQILKMESGISRAGNEWKKQEFVIETEEQFPRKVCFTLFNDKTSLLSGFNTGNEVEVSFNLESREFNGKWFTSVNAWKIERPAVGNSAETVPDYRPEYRMEDIPPEPAENFGTDLPF